ncbi:MAG: phosphatidylserine decarboxylase [Desulfococcaceae bacterium]
MNPLPPHQYIQRETARIQTEHLFSDRLVNALYSDTRERGSHLFRALTSARMSSLLGFLTYDTLVGAKLSGAGHFSRKLGIDLSECLDSPETLNTPRKLFERKIRYRACRPMDEDPAVVVSPADAKMLVGSFSKTSQIFLKEKFFSFEALLGEGRTRWLKVFADGDFAIFRLTPDKYHYNHLPVSGEVVDIYDIPGTYYPCNPGAVMALATPYSKNRRVVTVIDTDVQGGSGIGPVAMIEVAALMIGDIVQCYSEHEYDDPKPVVSGLFVKKGQPKSLYRPGSSTDVLIFRKNRIRFSFDIVMNMFHPGVRTRFSEGFGRPLVETEVALRSGIGRKINNHEGESSDE